jgi:hypothetical protein
MEYVKGITLEQTTKHTLTYDPERPSVGSLISLIASPLSHTSVPIRNSDKPLPGYNVVGCTADSDIPRVFLSPHFI